MKTTNFEDFLKDKHAENYHGFDDDMSDSFDAWLGELDGEEYIYFADEYANKIIESFRK